MQPEASSGRSSGPKTAGPHGTRQLTRRPALLGLALVTSILAALTLFLPSAASAASSDQAVAYQLDPAHDGYQTSSPITAPLTQAWSTTLSGSISYPLIVNGVVYVTAVSGSGGTTLDAIEQATGTSLWSHALGGTYPWSGLAYDAGQVFTVNTNGTLTAFDASTGATDWTTTLSGQTMFTSPPTATNGFVYTSGSGEGGTVYAVSESTGAVAWTQPVENGDHSSPAVDANGVYVTYDCDQDYAFNPLTGSQIWHYGTSCEGGGGKTPVLASGDVFGRDATSGNVVLSAATGASEGSFAATPAPAVGNGEAYMVSGGELTAVADSGLGSADWTFSGDGALDTAPLLVGGLVFEGSSGGNLYAIDASNGDSEWSASLGTDIPAPDEQNVSQPLTGMGAGEGTLIVPAGSELSAYTGANVGSGTPSNTSPPSVVGTPVVGRPVGADVGTWTALPTSYSYQWEQCDANGEDCSNIDQATDESYTPTSTELGTTLKVSVTATNTSGTASAVVSPPSNTVSATPLNTARPTISGNAVVGQTLTASTGSWDSDPTSYNYQWMRCKNDSCTPESGATANTYTVTEGDIGSQLEVQVTAVNSVGTATAASLRTSTVPPIATTLILTTSTNPAMVGDDVTFTALLSPSVDGGTVTFSRDGAPISGCAEIPVNAAEAVSCTLSAQTAGEDMIAASYSGDSNYQSAEASLTEVISPVSSPSPVVPPPPAPKKLHARHMKHGRVMLTWATTSGVRFYTLTVTRSRHTQVYKVPGSAHSFKLKLKPHQRVVVSLRAVAANGVAGAAAHVMVK